MYGFHRHLVLLVEDNAGDVRMVQEACKEAGSDCEIQVAQDGEEALNFLFHRGDFTDSRRPDLILLDLKLPGRDGLEVLSHIKTSPDLRTIPVLVLTSSSAPGDVQRAYDLGANCYMVKPARFGDLVEMAQLIKQFWLKVVKLHPV